MTCVQIYPTTAKERCKYRQGSKPNDDQSSQTAVMRSHGLIPWLVFASAKTIKPLPQGALLPTPDIRLPSRYWPQHRMMLNALGIDANRPKLDGIIIEVRFTKARPALRGTRKNVKCYLVINTISYDYSIRTSGNHLCPQNPQNKSYSSVHELTKSTFQKSTITYTKKKTNMIDVMSTVAHILATIM